MRKSDHPAGFTLVELMVTLAILAIVVAVAIPAIGSWWPNMKLSGAALDLYGTFQRAKVEASKRGRPCTVVFNANVDGQQYAYFLFQESNNLGNQGNFTPGNQFIFGTTDLPEAIDFDFAHNGAAEDCAQQLPQNAAGQYFITFRPNTLPVNAANAVTCGTIYLRNSKGQTQTVAINRVGNLTIR